MGMCKYAIISSRSIHTFVQYMSFVTMLPLPLPPGCEEVVRGEIPQPTDQERQEDSGRAILLQQVAILNSTNIDDNYRSNDDTYTAQLLTVITLTRN